MRFRGHEPESAQDRTKIAFKSYDKKLKELPLGQRVYDAPNMPQQIGIGLDEKRTIGQLDGHLQSLVDILKKTKFTGKLNKELIFELKEGKSDRFLNILHHLLFRASDMFSNHLISTGKISDDLKYVSNQKFFKAICLLLCDLFAYRVDLTDA